MTVERKYTSDSLIRGIRETEGETTEKASKTGEENIEAAHRHTSQIEGRRESSG